MRSLVRGDRALRIESTATIRQYQIRTVGTAAENLTARPPVRSAAMRSAPRSLGDRCGTDSWTDSWTDMVRTTLISNKYPIPVAVVRRRTLAHPIPGKVRIASRRGYLQV